MKVCPEKQQSQKAEVGRAPVAGRFEQPIGPEHNQRERKQVWPREERVAREEQGRQRDRRCRERPHMPDEYEIHSGSQQAYAGGADKRNAVPSGYGKAQVKDDLGQPLLRDPRVAVKCIRIGIARWECVAVPDSGAGLDMPPCVRVGEKPIAIECEPDGNKEHNDDAQGDLEPGRFGTFVLNMVRC